MNLIYQSADVLVSTTLDDLGPTIVIEGFMNRLRLVTFDLGVAVDLVVNGLNGYKVPCFDIEKLGKAIYASFAIKIKLNWEKERKLRELWVDCTSKSEALSYKKMFESLTVVNKDNLGKQC